MIRRDYTAHWGLTAKQIAGITQEDFAKLFGEKYMKMGYCEFRKKIKEDTPEIPDREFIPRLNWSPDRKVNKLEYIGCQLGVWDDDCCFI